MPDVEMRPTTRTRWLWSLGAVCFALACLAFALWRIEAQTAAELAEREARLASLALRERVMAEILDSRNVGSVILDEKGRVRDWNQAMERLSGWSAREMRGKNLSRIMSPNQWAKHEPGYREGPVNMDEFRLIECNLLPREGDPIPVVISGQRAKVGDPYNEVFALGIVKRREDVRVEAAE